MGCIAGALSIGEYRDGLAAAGFIDITIIPTHQVADGMHSAIVRARKPGRTPAAESTPARPTFDGAARDARRGSGGEVRDVERVGLRRVLVVLCVTEIVGWGVLYYAAAVLAPAILTALPR